MDRGLHLFFMGVIHVSMQKAHTDRLNIQPGQRIHQPVQFCPRQRLHHLTFYVHAFSSFKAFGCRHQRLRDFQIEVVKLIADFATDGQHITRALRHDQPGLGTFALDQRVGHQRSAVNDLGYRRSCTCARCGHLPQEINHHRGYRFTWITRRGQCFRDPDPATGIKHRQSVGESATDIDGNADSFVSFRFCHCILSLIHLDISRIFSRRLSHHAYSVGSKSR